MGCSEIPKKIAGLAQEPQGTLGFTKSVHVFHIRVGIILEINTCGKQGRALEAAADNSGSSCLMLAYASRIHYHLFFQQEGLHQQAAAPFGLWLSKRLKHWGLSEVQRRLCSGQACL